MGDGDRLVGGRYRLCSRLGSGAMGTVWRGEDVLLGRPVAVKEVVFPPGTRPEEAEVLRERTRREARAAARLDHPSAVTVYDAVEQDGRPWLVLELVEARSLAETVRDDGPLSPVRTAQVGLALLSALEAAHAQGIVHRDVKPGNVLLARSGRVVLTDFGIATSAGDSSLTSAGLLLGSPAYIAPERARGQVPGPASDLWSLGATLHTAVEGRPAYDEGGDPLRTVTAVVAGRRAPYVYAGPLAALLDGLLETDPLLRLDAARARAALEQVAGGRDTAAAHRHPVALRPDVTSALDLDAVRQEVADATGPLPVLPPAILPPAATAPAATAPATPAPAALPTATGPRTTLGARTAGRRWVVALGSAGLLAAAAVGGALLARPVAAPASTTTPAGVSVAATSRAAADVPAGWTTYTEPREGWSVAVPAEWVRSTHRDAVQFRDEQRRRTLRIDSSDDLGATALQSGQRASPALAAALQDYRQLRLEPVAFRGLDAAELEFTYTSRGTSLHVLDRRVVAGSTRQALYWQTRASDFADSRAVFEQVAASYSPAAQPG